jgi:hypothetical protein
VVDQIRAAGGRTDAVSTDLAAPDGAHTLAAQVRKASFGTRRAKFLNDFSRAGARTRAGQLTRANGM